MAAINPQLLTGQWVSGMAMDIHTISSTPAGSNEYGHMMFDTVRSELGELLYRLKNRGDQNAAPEIISTAVQYLRPSLGKFDRIIPVPPSAVRAVQPVILLANGIGASLGVPVVNCITATRPATQLKNITDPNQRREALEGLYR